IRGAGTVLGVARSTHPHRLAPDAAGGALAAAHGARGCAGCAALAWLQSEHTARTPAAAAARPDDRDASRLDGGPHVQRVVALRAPGPAVTAQNRLGGGGGALHAAARRDPGGGPCAAPRDRVWGS